jgi:Bacterial SH3 domain
LISEEFWPKQGRKFSGVGMKVREAFHLLLPLILATFSFDSSHGADQSKVDQLVRVIERLCLSGAQYQLEASADGDINLNNLSAGSQGSVRVNVKQQPGAVGYIRDEIRLKVDDGIRGCMAPWIGSLIDVILDRHGPTSSSGLAGRCTVTDPSGTPLNVRNAPQGSNIRDRLSNGSVVRVIRIVAENGEPWALIENQSGRELGWVYRPYITCDEDKAGMSSHLLSEACIVTDPTGTSLNVRNGPNGPTVIRTLSNGSRVKVLSINASSGQAWAYVANLSGQQLGWVYRRYIRCG